MADSGVPWSIKGISADGRALARDAAKRAGMPLGTWLARVIREVAATEARERRDAETEPNG